MSGRKRKYNIYLNPDVDDPKVPKTTQWRSRHVRSFLASIFFKLLFLCLLLLLHSNNNVFTHCIPNIKLMQKYLKV